MPLESASYVSGLVPTNPSSSDSLGQTDDHLRLLKQTLKNTFPNLSGPVTPTHDVLSALPGRADTLESKVAHGLLVGELKFYAGFSLPSGWLPCDGRAISRTDYAGLFAAIGTTFGSGDDLTTFNIPDCRGRVIAGPDGMYGRPPASRIGDIGHGSTLGTSTVTLTEAQIPSHSHAPTMGSAGSHAHSAWTDNQGLHQHTGNTSWQGDHTHGYVRSDGAPGGTPSNSAGGTAPKSIQTDPAGGHSHLFTTDAAGLHGHNIGMSPAGDHVHWLAIGPTGGSQSHSNVQPTILINTIIFTGVY